MASIIDNCYWMLLLTITILKIMKIAVLSIVSCYFNDYNWQVENITCKIIWEIVELDKISNWVDNSLKYC